MRQARSTSSVNAWFHRIGAFGFAYQPPVLLHANPPGTLAQGLASLRADIIGRLDAAIPIRNRRWQTR